MFWVISVYFNIRNTLPNSGTFLLGHPVYKHTHTHTHTHTYTYVLLIRHIHGYKHIPRLRNTGECIGKLNCLFFSYVCFLRNHQDLAISFDPSSDECKTGSTSTLLTVRVRNGESRKEVQKLLMWDSVLLCLGTS